MAITLESIKTLKLGDIIYYVPLYLADSGEYSKAIDGIRESVVVGLEGYVYNDGKDENALGARIRIAEKDKIKEVLDSERDGWLSSYEIKNYFISIREAKVEIINLVEANLAKRKAEYARLEADLKNNK